MKKLFYFGGSFIALALPAIASAQVAGNNLQSLIRFTGDILNMLIPIFIALALLAFFWGLVRYVWGNGTGGKESARGIMVAGILALFVMVSVWGIIRLAQNTLGINSGGALPAPSVPQR
jgi:hypothetical protein